MNSIYRLFILAVVLPFAARAEDLSHTSGEAVLNSFIATYAKAEVAWKKDILLNATPGQIAPGRQLGQSVAMGYYSFLPKVWSDLTPDEQRQVLTNPRLKAFLISCRIASTFPSSSNGTDQFPIEGAVLRPADTPAQSAAPASDNNAPVQVKVSPAAIMNGQPLRVDIPPTK